MGSLKFYKVGVYVYKVYYTEYGDHHCNLLTKRIVTKFVTVFHIMYKYKIKFATRERFSRFFFRGKILNLKFLQFFLYTLYSISMSEVQSLQFLQKVHI
jgi:hypothetical protein